MHVTFFACLCLQRFGLTLGNSVVFVSLPVFGALLAWMLATGRASISRNALVLYAVVGTAFLTSALVAELFPDSRVQNSLTSLVAVLVTYLLLTVQPKAFDRSRTLSIFLGYARVCAALGILQYWLQFVGIRLFSFSVAFPFLRPILVEHKYAFNPLLSYGSTTLRSNGFFLLEPSMFSQVLVLAVTVEVFVMRTYRYLPLYLAAYLFSYSGTGLVSLLIATAIYGVTSRRNVLRSAKFLALAAACIAIAVAVAPSVFASFAERANELQRSRSSGYLRYVAQFQSAAPFLSEARAIIGYGPGATERSVYFIEGTGSPILKLFVDYGFVGLGAFATYLGYTMRGRGFSMLSVLCLVIFQMGGGYLLFSPFIVLMIVLCVWSEHADPQEIGSGRSSGLPVRHAELQRHGHLF